jgi:cysteine desulfurase / selenocysteine lyase
MYSEEWVEGVRADFSALKHLKNQKPPVYLDNACTTMVPDQVIRAMDQYYTRYPGCGGTRSRYWYADEITKRIEGDPENNNQGSRQVIQEFIKAGSAKEIIFSLNTSYAINMAALGFNFRPGDAVLLTDKEHNSNLIPWLRLQDLGLIKVIQSESNSGDRFDFQEFTKKLENNKVRLVSAAYTSNLTGETLPVKEIIKAAHQHGARVLLDAAQAVSHQEIDVQDLDVDILAFSLHKMCGPKGIGVLYCKEELFGEGRGGRTSSADTISPVILGGGSVRDFDRSSYSLLDPPEVFEIGIQNYPGQIASAEAVRYIQRTGFEKIKAQEAELNKYLTEQLLDRYERTGWFKILGPRDPVDRGGILTFEVRRPNAVGIAEELSQKSNVMIRDGAFCVHSYLNKKFGTNWLTPKLPLDHRMTYRVSVYFYNTLKECRIFLETLHSIFEERSYV